MTVISTLNVATAVGPLISGSTWKVGQRLASSSCQSASRSARVMRLRHASSHSAAWNDTRLSGNTAQNQKKAEVSLLLSTIIYTSLACNRPQQQQQQQTRNEGP
jgi:hypothetical protein